MRETVRRLWPGDGDGEAPVQSLPKASMSPVTAQRVKCNCVIRTFCNFQFREFLPPIKMVIDC